MGVCWEVKSNSLLEKPCPMFILKPKSDDELMAEIAEFRRENGYYDPIWMCVNPKDEIDSNQTAYFFDSENKALKFTGGKRYGYMWEI